ncbi:MAG: hypothetical protein BGN96_12235 [Bacteroidales bacterium 45-6]|nr:MAG: hypothetical protein BGN96_12235 [Bacteroidales bacterium 45-6]
MAKKTENERRELLWKLFGIMLNGGTVEVKDGDGKEKVSTITAVYCDDTLTLPDAINSDRSIWDVIISSSDAPIMVECIELTK